MGITVHEATARAALVRLIADGGSEALASYQQALRDRRWTDSYVAAIGQMETRSAPSWPMEQIAMFAQVHTMIDRGHVAMAEIAVGCKPFRDSAREENAAALRLLPSPFIGEVCQHQNGGDSDGLLTWDDPIEASICSGQFEPDGRTPVARIIEIPPGSAPLEIGTTLPSRTWFHLRQQLCVARWAYGSDAIRLLIAVSMEHPLDRELTWRSRQRDADFEAGG